MATASGVGDNKIEVPELPKMPTLDPKALAAKTQEISAPSISRLRSALARIKSQSFPNPAARAAAMRQALSGFGVGVGAVSAGAGRQAISELTPDLRARQEARLAKFRADVLAAQQQRSEQAVIDAETRAKEEETGGYEWSPIELARRALLPRGPSGVGAASRRLQSTSLLGPVAPSPETSLFYKG